MSEEKRNFYDPKYKPYDGWYKGIYCQSQVELSFVIHMMDLGKKVERNQKAYPYTYNGIQYDYIPDFIVEGKHYEVKGSAKSIKPSDPKKWMDFRDIHGLELEVWTDQEIDPIQAAIRQKYGVQKVKDLYEKKEGSAPTAEFSNPVKTETISYSDSPQKEEDSEPKEEKLKPHFLAYDTETGGLDPDKHSILTYHGILLTKEFEIIDEIGFNLKPDNGDYCVTPKALETNGINLVEHDKVAIPYSQAGQEFKSFLAKYCENGSPYPKRLFAVGQNIQFDYGFVTKTFAKDAMDKYMTRGGVDLYTLSLTLNSLGKIRNLKNWQLGTMCKFFEVEFQAHNCKEDIHATVKCIKKCLELMK